MLIKYYDLVAESMLDNKPLEDGALYFCADSGNIYLDSNSSGRINVGGSLIILDTEEERLELLAPIPNKLYYIKDSNRIYIYNENAWNPINPTDATLKLSGVPADAKAVGDEFIKINTEPRDYIILKDISNGLTYLVQMENGTLISFARCTSIEVTSLPTKMVYMEGDGIDLTGIVITGTREDGSTFTIDNYTHSAGEIISDTTCNLTYIECGKEYTTFIEFTIIPFDPEVALIDFDYVAEEDGTYTITGWKGTLNGEASTEIIIPNNNHVNV